MTHDDVRDLGAEYAAGTLAAGNREAIDRHLAVCPECRAFVQEDLRAFDAIGRGVPQAAPPAGLRARVLRAALAEQRAAGGAARRLGRSSPLPWMLAAAAALVALIAGWQLMVVRGERTRLAAQLAEQARSTAVLGAGDLVRFDLRGEAAGPARARAFWSRRHGMVFTAEGLPALPAGRTFQLWVISRGTPISGGVFDTTADGRARLVMATPETLEQVEAVAVTIEPSGGLAAPSSPPILAGAALD